MDIDRIRDHLASLPGVEVVSTADTWFYFYDPRGDSDPAKRQPFATIVTSDAHDQASDLSARPGVFRLNLGVESGTYRKRFGPEPKGWEEVGKGHDFTRLDALLPHPVYSLYSWVCILSPSDASWEREVQALVAEAYGKARREYDRRSAHASGPSSP